MASCTLPNVDEVCHNLRGATRASKLAGSIRFAEHVLIYSHHVRVMVGPQKCADQTMV